MSFKDYIEGCYAGLNKSLYIVKQIKLCVQDVNTCKVLQDIINHIEVCQGKYVDWDKVNE